MNAEQILFILFGAVSLIGAVAVISFRHPIYSALSLVVTFFAQAGLFLLLGAHFVAAVQVIVYAGAIMVLFLFVIMLLNLGTLSVKGAIGGKLKGFAIILGILLAIEGIYIATNVLNNTAIASAQPATASPKHNDVRYWRTPVQQVPLTLRGYLADFVGGIDWGYRLGETFF